MEIKKFGVIGSGTMGNGIAQVAAFSGLKVIVVDNWIGQKRPLKKVYQNLLKREK